MTVHSEVASDKYFNYDGYVLNRKTKKYDVVVNNLMQKDVENIENDLEFKNCISIENLLFDDVDEKNHYYSNLIGQSITNIICKSISLEKKAIIVVGFGNRNIYSDALGSLVCERILTTMSNTDVTSMNKVAAFTPSIVGVTGLESLDLVSAVVDKFKPDIILEIDALSTDKIERIGSVVQIMDGVMTPGSGFNSVRLSNKSFDFPVFSLGVPLVLNLNNELKSDKYLYGGKFFSPYCIDVIVKKIANVVAKGVNYALFPYMKEFVDKM